MKECERLRGHLLHIEEGYTREAIEAEEREKQLRNQLASAEEKISSSSAAIHSARCGWRSLFCLFSHTFLRQFNSRNLSSSLTKLASIASIYLLYIKYNPPALHVG